MFFKTGVFPMFIDLKTLSTGLELPVGKGLRSLSPFLLFGNADEAWLLEERVGGKMIVIEWKKFNLRSSTIVKVWITL